MRTVSRKLRTELRRQLKNLFERLLERGRMTTSRRVGSHFMHDDTRSLVLRVYSVLEGTRKSNHPRMLRCDNNFRIVCLFSSSYLLGCRLAIDCASSSAATGSGVCSASLRSSIGLRLPAKPRSRAEYPCGFLPWCIHQDWSRGSLLHRFSTRRRLTAAAGVGRRGWARTASPAESWETRRSGTFDRITRKTPSSFLVRTLPPFITVSARTAFKCGGRLEAVCDTRSAPVDMTSFRSRIIRWMRILLVQT